MTNAQLSLRYKNGSLEIERVLYVDGLRDSDDDLRDSDDDLRDSDDDLRDSDGKNLIDESFIEWLKNEGLRI
jgi:hypothetical protein